MKIAYFDCFSGASGDMLLGSLLDAGLSFGDLEADLGALGVGGYQLEAERVSHHGLAGTHLRVTLDSSERPARHLSTIEHLIGESSLPRRVKERSVAVFRRLAQAEADAHGVAVEEVHFHEIGAVDTLVDIVGFVTALEHLGIEAVFSSPLMTGWGTVDTEHGLLPVPAPATLALLSQSGAPTSRGPAEREAQPTWPASVELLTPTGAVLLTHFATFHQPAMHIQAVGYGFGSKQLPWPNGVRVWIGEIAESPLDHDEVVLLTCNLDNVTGEALGYAMDRLFQAGALDAWFSPIQMKKSRPAYQLSVLAEPADTDKLAAIVLRETPTLGLRYQRYRRAKASREIGEVQTPWGAVRIKIKRLGNRVISAAPEYDDCAALAAREGIPFEDVASAARA
ncbi:MAG TPA: nickel pincer cofactor biosynthesis protein LarC, partial [Anaerolineae bacterium]|nr:nickel pincer cofactor biosynthesis protein LarC [Anaerolineae bacterium]